MNEDEGFIRAIVGNCDDLSRLVYADWLDDRDDPRGAYLRAEREAVSREQLRELAACLDPVWVARVSRPPLGVCCDPLTWSERRVGVSGDEVTRFEKRFAVTLPVAYRAFLLNGNGGLLSVGPANAMGGVRCRFSSLAGTSGNDPEGSLEYEYAVRRLSLYRGTPRETPNYHVRLRNHMIIGQIDRPYSLVLLGATASAVGHVRFHQMRLDHNDDESYDALRFGSLSDFLCFVSHEQQRRG